MFAFTYQNKRSRRFWEDEGEEGEIVSGRVPGLPPLAVSRSGRRVGRHGGPLIHFRFGAPQPEPDDPDGAGAAAAGDI